MDNRPIGIFDSGLGGLTVAAALRRELPSESIIYLGDTARVPYGSKSRDTIVQFAIDDARFLVEREVKAVVVACNTVSALAIPALEAAFPGTPFIGVVEAGAAMALRLTDARRVVVLGTTATVNSDSYRRLLHASNRELAVQSLACPLFVPLAEEGMVDGEIAERVLDLYLGALRPAPPDVLILGCTHYPLLRPLIAAYLPTVRIIDSAEACAAGVTAFLRREGMAASPENPGAEQFFVTDMPASFFALASRFLGYPIPRVDKVMLS